MRQRGMLGDVGRKRIGGIEEVKERRCASWRIEFKGLNRPVTPVVAESVQKYNFVGCGEEASFPSLSGSSALI